MREPAGNYLAGGYEDYIGRLKAESSNSLKF
jgi:hypothetical protein